MRLIAFLLVTLLWTSQASAINAASAPAEKFSKDLRDKCDTLIASAEKRPYGWAWQAPVDNEKTPGIVVTAYGKGAGAGGIVLWLGGKSIGEAKYTDAALMVARGLIAIQEPSGRLPALATFGAHASSRDTPSPTPNLAPTREGLALLLMILDGVEKPDPQLLHCAQNAATWLARQQLPNGGWPTSNGQPRCMTLADGDYRDNTLTMLMAYEVLQDPAYRRSALAATDQLLKMRLDAPNFTKNLWTGAYGFDGKPLENAKPGVDLPATVNAIQTLLATYLLLGRDPDLAAATLSADGAINLPHDDKDAPGYQPLYLVDAATTVPSTAPSPQPPGNRRPTFGIEDTSSALAKIKEQGRAPYQSQMEQYLGAHTSIYLTMAGINERPMTLEAPPWKEDARAWLADEDKLILGIETLKGPSVKAQVIRGRDAVIKSAVSAWVENSP